MKDVLLATIAGMVLFVALDVDGSVWHDPHRVGAYYSKLLLACMQGRGFSTNSMVVLCDVTEIARR